MWLRMLVGLGIVLSGSSLFAQPEPTARTLRQASQGHFEIGAGISDQIFAQEADWGLLTDQFSIVTPENCMKPQSLQPRLGEFRWETADQFVAFAVGKKLRVVGHCLLWAKDDRTHPWYYLDGDQPASREVLLKRIESDVTTTVARYRGKIAMWDVVNEVLADGEDGYLRPSGYVTACGDEFLRVAFQAAHRADPDALLIYNDYNNEFKAKREKMLKLIDWMQREQIPVHAIGLQGHYEIDRIPYEEIEATIQAIQSRGLKIVVSELDIDMVPRGKWWAEDGKYRDELSRFDPYRDGCPAELLQRQAEQYGRLFRLFSKYSETILRVSFWNLHDGQSWLNDFPWNRVNYPLLFDRNRQPKPAFLEVMKALGE